MGIELHCPQCTKLIRAPDGAGGKRGKCPYCGNKVYIPSPPDSIETLAIAPLDEDEERREAELKRESAKYAAIVSRGGKTDDAPAEGPVDVGADIEAFVLAMHQSNLDDADAAVARLKQAASKAKSGVKSAMSSDTSSALSDVPAPLVQGFLKMLLGRIG